MAYDSARGKVVLFGGITDTGDSDETWEWDGANWTQPPPIGKPSAMHLHAMAYDGVRRKVVLFGENLFYSRVMTLEWDGSNWIQRLLADKPSLRYGHAMAYDSIYGKVIMFGGFTDTGFSDETWEWDGAANDRPGQIMIVNFGNTGIATDASVQSVSILFNAGGIGYGGANCGMVNGAKMLVWNDKLGRWVDVAANSSPASMLYKLAWSTTDRNFIDHMFVGDNKELNVAVVPVSPNGCGSKMGSVATSYSEVTISYVLP
jgi:hypothetical protein